MTLTLQTFIHLAMLLFSSNTFMWLFIYIEALLETKWLGLGGLFVCFLFLHFIIPFGKFGPPCLSKAIAAATQSYKCMLGFFSCFRNPPNSDMDYRIFNVHMWSFVCVHAYNTHRGWAHWQVSTTFFSRKKITIFFCAPDWAGIRTWGVWISSLMLYQLSHPVTPWHYFPLTLLSLDITSPWHYFSPTKIGHVIVGVHALVLWRCICSTLG